MNPTTYGPPARFVLALAAFAGSLLIPFASTAGVDTLPGVAATAAAEANHLRLAQAEAVPSERRVSYTDEQADRGERRYTQVCEECHGDDLNGGMNGGPPLRGASFEQTYANGAPASGLFLFMSTAMPPESPGRYSASAYADLMAYVLKQNGFSIGEALPSDYDALDKLIMQK